MRTISIPRLNSRLTSFPSHKFPLDVRPRIVMQKATPFCYLWLVRKPCARTTFNNFAKGRERKERNRLLAFFDDGYRCGRRPGPALQRREYKHIQMKWIVVLDTCRLLLRLVRRAYPQRDETPFCCPQISKLLADNGPQFASREFKSFASEWGLEHITSSSYSPQSNGPRTYLGNARWF